MSHLLDAPTLLSPSPAFSSATPFCRPHYDSVMRRDGLELQVYVPGVPAHGIEITTSGPDLVVLARKRPGVRVNWTALQLERAQRDYRLHLRLGRGLDYTALQAELADGILTLRLPRKPPAVRADRCRPLINETVRP